MYSFLIRLCDFLFNGQSNLVVFVRRLNKWTQKESSLCTWAATLSRRVYENSWVVALGASILSRCIFRDNWAFFLALTISFYYRLLLVLKIQWASFCTLDLPLHCLNSTRVWVRIFFAMAPSFTMIESANILINGSILIHVKIDVDQDDNGRYSIQGWSVILFWAALSSVNVLDQYVPHHQVVQGMETWQWKVILKICEDPTPIAAYQTIESCKFSLVLKIGWWSTFILPCT